MRHTGSFEVSAAVAWARAVVSVQVAAVREIKDANGIQSVTP